MYSYLQSNDIYCSSKVIKPVKIKENHDYSKWGQYVQQSKQNKVVEKVEIWYYSFTTVNRKSKEDFKTKNWYPN